MTRHLARLSLLILTVLGIAGAGRCSTGNGPTGFARQRLNAIKSQLMTDPVGALASADAYQREVVRRPRDQVGSADLAVAYWMKAAALSGLDRPSEAVEAAQQALKALSRATPNSSLRADILIARGEAYSSEGKIQDSLADFQTAFGLYGINHQARDQAVALLHIAALYSAARDYRTTIKYSNEAIEIYPTDDKLLLSANNEIGNAFSQLDEPSSAEARFQTAAALAGRLQSPLLQARILTNLAEAQIKGNDLTGAQASVNRAYELARSGPAAKWKLAIDVTQAKISFLRGNFSHAETLIDGFFSMRDLSPVAPVLRDAHLQAYAIYKRGGNLKRALIHLESFKTMDDQSRALAASAGAALMSARFDFANQDLKISRLRQAQAEREAVLARTRVHYHMVVTGGLLAAAAIITTLLAIGFLSIRRSRNQVRAANAELQDTNLNLEKALAVKTEFLATTSHEIRTPLNGILGMTQVLLADRALARDLKTRVELIHGAGETMRALVDDILDMAKMETGELRIHPAEMDLHRLLRDAAIVWAGQAETKGLALSTEVEDVPRGIVADEVRLRQIIFNLMSNAIKFTDRGDVRIIATVSPSGEGEAIRIRVEDSGIGIPADRLADIFEAFRQVDGGVTRRHGGTGLGLAICRNLARAMGGDVTVDSVEGVGSTFVLDLPLVRADLPAAVAGHAPGAVGALAEAGLLVIEPNPLSGGILRALLGPAAASLHVSSDLDDARAMLAAGGVDHVLADAGAFALDAEAAAHFAETVPALRKSLLWPSPDEAALAVLVAGGWTQVIAKPLSGPDLLVRLQIGYGSDTVERDLAA